MTTLEFINGMTQTLAWPVLIAVLLLYYRNKLSEFAIEMMGAKFQVKLIKEGESQNTNAASPQIKHESAHYKLYSNGLLVQKLRLRVAPMIEELDITYPITFSNELLSIQAVGNETAWPTKVSLGNCKLKIVPSRDEREIQLTISGI